MDTKRNFDLANFNVMVAKLQELQNAYFGRVDIDIDPRVTGAYLKIHAVASKDGVLNNNYGTRDFKTAEFSDFYSLLDNIKALHKFVAEVEKLSLLDNEKTDAGESKDE